MYAQSSKILNVLKIRSAVLEMLRTDRRRDMATVMETFLQIVVAKAPKWMSNALSTLPKALRTTEHVHPAIWSYSPDQDIDWVVLVAFLWVEPSGSLRHSVQSVVELATRLTRNRNFARCFSKTMLHFTCLPHTSYSTLPPPTFDLPKGCSVISR